MINYLKNKFINLLFEMLYKRTQNRPPDFTVGENYLRRWWIIPRNNIFNIYLHHFRVSDDDRASHDHPYINISILLQGSYIEHTPNGKFIRTAGDVKIRLPKTLHRLELLTDSDGKSIPTWTLFITGPRIRNWGFQVGPIVRNWLGFRTKSGWMDHESYIEKYGEQTNM